MNRSLGGYIAAPDDDLGWSVPSISATHAADGYAGSAELRTFRIRPSPDAVVEEDDTVGEAKLGD
jgi:hypothetical protein